MSQLLPAADVIYLNGNILTMDPSQPGASAIALKGQVLLCVGTDDQAMALAGEQTEVHDLGGRTVLPGLIEGHMHFVGLGRSLLEVDVQWRSKEEILEAVMAKVAELPPGEWILGRGWNQEVWPDRLFPSRQELDAVAPDHPVVLARTCGHALWANSLALSLAGITAETLQPPGGEIVVDEVGRPTGVLIDSAAGLMWRAMPANSPEAHKEALLAAQAHLFALGVTSLVDAGSDVDVLSSMKALYRSGELRIRTYAMVNEPQADGQYESGPEVDLFDGRLTIRCVKAYGDGSLGARSAWMEEEYADRPGHFGAPLYSDEALLSAVREAVRRGFQASVHAIGDRAVEQVLDAYEHVQEEIPAADRRLRIEHFQSVSRRDLERAVRLRVVPAMQAVHATSDMDMAEARLGASRAGMCYAWRDAIDAGLIVVGGSDAPVESANPFFGIHAAVTRRSRAGNERGSWHPEQCMSRSEALASFTTWAAYGQFEEEIKGSLTAGRLADFVVVDRDPLTCPPEELKDVRVLMTVLGGETVWRL